LFFKDKNFFSIFLERLVEKIKLIKRGSSKKYNFFIKKEIKERFEKSSPRAKKQKDNLRIIEGVGPKIESLLEREQIASFKQLSQTNMEQLKDILKKAGDRYAFHNPAT
jgi:predicted flap endonuclease-1-like 5' DNA nuclease